MADMSLHGKVIIMCLMLTGMVAGILLTATVSYFKGTVKDSVTEAIGLAVRINAGSLAELTKRLETSLDLVNDNGIVFMPDDTAMQELCHMIHEYQKQPDHGNLWELRQEYEKNGKRFQNYFQMCFGDSVSWCSWLFVDDRYDLACFLGKRVTLSEKQTGFYSCESVKEEAWYRDALAADGEVIWFTKEEEPGKLYMARLLKYSFVEKNKIHQDPLGVLAVSFDVSWVAEQIDPEGITGEGSILLTDRNGKCVYRTGKYTGEEADCLIREDELSLGLKMITVVPLREIDRKTGLVFRRIFIAAALAVGAAAVCAVWISRRLVRPIRRLSEHMEKGEAESISLYGVGENEVGKLYVAFNYLAKQQKKAMQEVIESARKEQLARLHALQAQMNPHFIYNTLNSVSCLAMLYGKKDIAEVLSCLVQIMRYNIKEPDQMVSIAQETEMIRCYEKIQQCCYGERIRFLYNIEERALQRKIPKMIIQPLVENAVVHGTGDGMDCAEIELGVYLKEKALVIRVKDSGNSTDTERINRYLKGEQVLKSTYGGIGIRNITERLKLVYGENAKLEYFSDGGTVAQIKIYRGLY